jgi:hypothetical protein
MIRVSVQASGGDRRNPGTCQRHHRLPRRRGRPRQPRMSGHRRATRTAPHPPPLTKERQPEPGETTSPATKGANAVFLEALETAAAHMIGSRVRILEAHRGLDRALVKTWFRRRVASRTGILHAKRDRMQAVIRTWLQWHTATAGEAEPLAGSLRVALRRCCPGR